MDIPKTYMVYDYIDCSTNACEGNDWIEIRAWNPQQVYNAYTWVLKTNRFEKLRPYGCITLVVNGEPVLVDSVTQALEAWGKPFDIEPWQG